MPSVKLNAIDRLRPISSYAIISAAILLLLFIAGPSPLFSRQDVELHVESNLGASSLKSGELVARNDDPNNPSWDQRVATGRMLWCLMANPSATQSAFTWDDLGRWGWDTLDISKTQIALYQDPISGAYEEYNIEASKDSGTGILQSEDFKDKDGTIQEPTMGSYQNLVNAASGSIVAGDNTSPRERYPQFYDEEPEPNQLPDLQKWSDIVGLQWQRDAQGATIKYIFRSNIANTNTKSMIRTAFIKAGQTEVGTYPGFDFTIGSDETGPQATRFFGLLGTYHGAGPAYLLAQHRTDFGHKRITKIRIWNPAPAFPVSGTDYRELAPSMMLFVEDVPSTT